LTCQGFRFGFDNKTNFVYDFRDGTPPDTVAVLHKANDTTAFLVSPCLWLLRAVCAPAFARR
jgi:hypothetical protein